MTAKRQIPKWKVETVKELKDLIKTSKTFLVASIKGLPGSQFQEISKKLRGKAIVKVPKKNLIIRAIDESEEGVKSLREKIDDSFALLFSKVDAFDLALELIKSKSPAKAKPGQEAPMDIEVSAGPTDLVPGPAISELGALGIQIQIKNGKIEIKEPKIIVKAGQKISDGAANMMAKLNIKPFSIGFIPVAAYDSEGKKIYLSININPEETLEQLKSAFGRALPFAVGIGYSSKETIGYLLAKASMHASAIEKVTQTPQIEGGQN